MQYSRKFGRRLITIPVLMAATVTVTVTLPFWLIPVGILSFLPNTRGAVPTAGFMLGYLWLETAGILAAFAIWIRHRKREQFLEANYKLQSWWASSLKMIAAKLFRLTFEVEGTGDLVGPPVIMMPRHTSIADSIIPMVFYAFPQQIRLRYVLKRELLLDPCLDVVGHRLPNYFVDRDGRDTVTERKAVARLLADLRSNEGALIYPEGTRFSAKKHARLVERYAESKDMQTQLHRWTEILPPRLGGTLAMLQANPGLDLVFCAHTGFEGSSHFRSLINGSWIKAHIRILFWRIPYNAIPSEPDAQRDFLFNQWDRMQAEVRRMGVTASISIPEQSQRL
jgi:1-acyl-sn-glycerol-3-phosphate acyltransferase